MYNFIKSHCVSNFFVFDEYEILFFDQEHRDYEEFPAYALYPTNIHFQLYEEITGEKVTSLTGIPAAIQPTLNAATDFLENKTRNTFYNPLEDSKELYLEMAKIELFDEKSLLKFSKEYGLPAELYFHEGETFNIEDPQKKIFKHLDLLVFYKELSIYKKIFNIWIAVKNSDRNALYRIKNEFEIAAHEAQKSWNEQIVDIYYSRYFYKTFDTLKRLESSSSHSLLEKWDKNKSQPLEQIAQTYLIHLLNEQNSGKYEFCITDNQIVPAVNFNDLIEVSYYQLSQAIVNNVELRECLNCGCLFEPFHGNQKFCAPIRGRKRSTCENTYNQRMKRRRKAQRH